MKKELRSWGIRDEFGFRKASAYTSCLSACFEVDISFFLMPFKWTFMQYFFFPLCPKSSHTYCSHIVSCLIFQMWVRDPGKVRPAGLQCSAQPMRQYTRLYSLHRLQYTTLVVLVIILDKTGFAQGTKKKSNNSVFFCEYMNKITERSYRSVIPPILQE